MSVETATDDEQLRLLGPIVAVTALALAAVVLVGAGQVKVFWWLLMLAVAAPAVVELALEWRRRRAAQPATSSAGGRTRHRTASAVDDTPVAPPATPPVPPLPAAPAQFAVPAEEVTQQRPRVVAPSVPHAAGDPRSDRILERSRLSASTEITAVQIPKSTSDLSTCEDAVDADDSGLVVAVSDGASSAFMSRAWARILVAGFVEQPPAPTLDSLHEWTVRMSERWGQIASDATGERGTEEWWNQASTDRGSSATILGLRLVPTGSGFRWSAIAIGDTIVAQVRSNPQDGGVALIRSFPIEGADTFDATPELLPTTATLDVAELPALRFTEGTAEPGDSLLVMTDALAQWALRSEAEGRAPWTWLLGATGTELEALVSAGRSDGTLVDDDVTLVRVSALQPAIDPAALR